MRRRRVVEQLELEGAVAARLARAHLLVEGGTFAPCKVQVYAALASIRTTQVNGFDLRLFNAFRSNLDTNAWGCQGGVRCSRAHLRDREVRGALPARRRLRRRGTCEPLPLR